jgi:hypothetical protein
MASCSKQNSLQTKPKQTRPKKAYHAPPNYFKDSS